MTAITIVGNLADEVELRYTSNGRAVARFRVLENRRTRNSDGDWIKDEPNAFRVQVWGQQAENVAQHCHTGDRVHVSGAIVTDSWQDKETNKIRRAQKIVADEVSKSLRFAHARAAETRHSNTTPESAAPVEQTSATAYEWDTAPLIADDQPI